jgi:predicted RNase H-like HicB family nuclease
VKRYTVIVEKTPNNYSAYVPDLPGCISTGDTVDDVVANMEEAITVHLETPRRW